MPDYDDGYLERSPVGSFRSNQNGLNDITGNLSEWVNDFYSIEIIDPSEIFTDYIGPTVGTTHVIKGSNHYSSTPLQLGLSYRTYGNAENELVGFRIADGSTKNAVFNIFTYYGYCCGYCLFSIK